MTCPICLSIDVYSSDGRHSCRTCAYGWKDGDSHYNPRAHRARLIMAADYGLDIKSADDPTLPRYVRSAAKRHPPAKYVHCGSGSFQMMTAADCAELIRNTRYLMGD